MKWKTIAIISIGINIVLVVIMATQPPFTPEDIARSMNSEDRSRIILELQRLEQD